MNPEKPVNRWLNYCLASLLLLSCFALPAQDTDERESCVEGTEAETCFEEDSGMDKF